MLFFALRFFFSLKSFRGRQSSGLCRMLAIMLERVELRATKNRIVTIRYASESYRLINMETIGDSVGMSPSLVQFTSAMKVASLTY